MERQKVSEIARKLGVSCQSVYKKLARGDNQLTPHVFKEGKATFLDAEGCNILSGMFEKPVVEALSPVDNQVENLVTTIKDQLREKQGTIEIQQRTIESLIAQNEEQRKRTDTILMKLTNDISTLQKCLEYKVPETKRSVEVSEPPLNSKKVDISAPIRAIVLEPTQRKITFLESIKLGLDDCCGLLFGRG